MHITVLYWWIESSGVPETDRAIPCDSFVTPGNTLKLDESTDRCPPAAGRQRVRKGGSNGYKGLAQFTFNCSVCLGHSRGIPDTFWEMGWRRPVRGGET